MVLPTFFRKPQTFGIVGESEILAVAVGRNQSPALGPGHGPILAVVVGGRIAGSVIGNGVSVVFRQQVPPGGIAVGVAVAGGPVGGGQNIAHRVVGIGVGLSAAGLLRQLVLGIVGIGVGGAVFRVSGDVAQYVIGVAVGNVRGQIVLQLRNLGGGICGGDIPVGVGLLVDTASDGRKPLQGIIPVGQCVAHCRFVGSQQAGCFTISVRFGIIGASQLPVLSGQLVIGIIGLMGGNDIARGVLNSTGHQPAQRIIGVFVGVACLAVMHRMKLSGYPCRSRPTTGTAGAFLLRMVSYRGRLWTFLRPKPRKKSPVL